jgi:hypothetical protein
LLEHPIPDGAHLGNLRLEGVIPAPRSRLVRRAKLLVEQLRDFPCGEHEDGPDALEVALPRRRPAYSNGSSTWTTRCSTRSTATGRRLTNWPPLSAELPANRLAESREQYLACAIKVWESCLKVRVRDPSLTVDTLDVHCVLFGRD